MIIFASHILPSSGFEGASQKKPVLSRKLTLPHWSIRGKSG